MSRTAAPERSESPAMDPRVAARRAEVQRARKRTVARRLGLGSALVAVPIGVWVVLQSSALDVDRLEVVGSTRTVPSAVVSASGIEAGDPLVTLDVSGAARAIEALPWVDQAWVVRTWPDGVRISVTERRARSVVNGEDDRWRLVDLDGRVLDTVEDPPTGVVPVLGPVPAGDPGTELDERAAAAVSLATGLPSALAGKVREVRWSDDGSLELVLPDGAQVLLGSVDAMADKLVSLVAVLGEPIPEGSLIDLRAGSAPVVRPALTGEGA